MMFFCYEKSTAGKWCPVVYHGEKPSKSVNGSVIIRSNVWQVPDECISNGEPMFGALQRKYERPE